MNKFKSFEEDLPLVTSTNFETFALELFHFQALNNKVYGKYLSARNIAIEDIKSVDQIPFMPIRFFKDFDVISGNVNEFPGYFSSSGTTGTITSKHYFWSEEFYRYHALSLFEKTYGDIQNYHVMALLPAYLERKGSSLVSMAAHFIQMSESSESGFYLYNHSDLVKKLYSLKNDSRKILLLGVTFALLDLAENKLDFPEMDNLIVMETGGMKGRRKELIREEVHDILIPAFHVNDIHSEYGMTELMSQAYSKGDGKYTLPQCMRVMLRDVNDPAAYTQKQQGGINVIDLANFHSCAFIETQDLGRFDENGKLEVLGRFDNSEVRGCNLMIN